MHVPRHQKKVWDPLGVELKLIVSRFAGTGHRAQRSHRSSPEILFQKTKCIIFFYLPCQFHKLCIVKYHVTSYLKIPEVIKQLFFFFLTVTCFGFQISLCVFLVVPELTL